MGQKKPNAWGLFDVLGGVAELVWDEYRYEGFNSPDEALVDPVVGGLEADGTTERSLRGGNLFERALDCRFAFRGQTRQTGGSTVGFRPVRTLKPK